MTATNDGFLRARQHAPGGEDIVWAEPTLRHVRVFFGGVAVADSNAVVVLFNGRRVPVYYFPRSDVRMDLVEEGERFEIDPRLGKRSYASLTVGQRRADDAVFSYRQVIDDGPDLSNFVSFAWDAMDAWFEEDEQILRHARDPYKRVDVLHSSRKVRVIVGGSVIANTTRPMLLFETGLPVRYYIPKLDVRLELLTPSATRTRCPYKGEAIYWNLDVNEFRLEDVVWSYPAPIPEIPKIENLLAFYNERVDLEVDGVLLEHRETADR
jgi:uncharacterized protein (DUF427 family)